MSIDKKAGDTMYGLIMTEPGHIEMQTYASEENLQDRDIKIKLLYGGICGSDVGVYKGKIVHASYPVRPGHELLGEIIETGENALLQKGTRVVIQPNSYCGECEYCAAGMTNICPEKKSLGINVDGGFAEQFTINEKYAIPVPEELSDEKAVLVEPFSVIVHAFRKIRVDASTKIAIVGCGTEGILAIGLAEHLGADVTAIDINEEKLQKVNQHYKQVHTMTPGQAEQNQYDYVLEAAGAKGTFEKSLDIVKPGGEIVVIGLAPHADLEVSKAVRKEVTVYGSIIYQAPKDFITSMDYLKRPSLNVEPVISKIFALKDYQTAYEDAVSGHYGKIIINFKEDAR